MRDVMRLEERKRKEIAHSELRRKIVKAHEYKTDAGGGYSIYVTDRDKYKKYFSNMKYYSVTRLSETYHKQLILQRCKNAVALDYCCGNGEVAVFMAQNGAKVYGIDISEVAIENAEKLASQERVSDSTSFMLMDAEDMNFEDDFFEVIHVYGALHHLDVEKAMRELSRVLKPNGIVVCTEAIAHNPIIHLYRKMTPHLRTEWEVDHILTIPKINEAKKYFLNVDPRFFHLAAIAAVPFRKTPLFEPVLSLLESVDGIILKTPYLQRMAWIVVFSLSSPIKNVH